MGSQMPRATLGRRAGSASVLAVTLVTALFVDAATARPRRPPHHGSTRWEARPPSPDAVDLGTLAPPTRLSTLEQNYGDAAIARAHVRDRGAADGPIGRGDEVSSPYVQFPCDPRAAGAAAYRCGPASGIPGYGLGYAYNPAYVTSPFSSGHDPREQAPMLPGVTGLFWTVNGLAAGHLD